MTILFDLDGTLIDSTEAILESFGVAFDEFETPRPSDDEIKSLVGFPLDIMFGRLGIDSKVVMDYVARYKIHYREICKTKTKLLPQARDAIALASTFATLGVVTTKTGSYSIDLLSHWDVWRYFDTMVGRENVQNPKPHKEPIELALSNLNKPKSNAWIIGDTILDAQSAKDANINSICVTCGYGKEKDLVQYANIIQPTAYEAVKYLQSLQE